MSLSTQNFRFCANPACFAIRATGEWVDRDSKIQKTVEKLKVCTGCLTQRYCNTACQAADWKRHKKECAQTRHQTSRFLPFCANSGCVSDEKLKTCARCLRRSYCGKKCQKADWKEHKKNCTPPASLKIPTKACSPLTLTTLMDKTETVDSSNQALLEEDHITAAQKLMDQKEFKQAYKLVSEKVSCQNTRKAFFHSTALALVEAGLTPSKLIDLAQSLGLSEDFYLNIIVFSYVRGGKPSLAQELVNTCNNPERKHTLSRVLAIAKKISDQPSPLVFPNAEQKRQTSSLISSHLDLLNSNQFIAIAKLLISHGQLEEAYRLAAEKVDCKETKKAFFIFTVQDLAAKGMDHSNIIKLAQLLEIPEIVYLKTLIVLYLERKDILSACKLADSAENPTNQGHLRAMIHVALQEKEASDSKAV